MSIIRPNPNLVRMGDLKRKPEWQWTGAECLEYIQLCRLERERLDALIEEERTEARQYPARLSPHDD